MIRAQFWENDLLKLCDFEDFMPSFKYRARDLQGKAITGLLEGDDKALVAEQIQRLGYIPVEIELAQKEKK